ncbi:MAG TPA: hypothetical protein VNZ04_13970 [Trinickia sp.]|jgi:hypothetical protein|nr:hypothetical protein [Trinickia sp.]
MSAKTDGVFLTVETIPKTLTFRLTTRDYWPPTRDRNRWTVRRVFKFGPDFLDPLIAQAMA